MQIQRLPNQPCDDCTCLICGQMAGLGIHNQNLCIFCCNAQIRVGVRDHLGARSMCRQFNAAVQRSCKIIRKY